MSIIEKARKFAIEAHGQQVRKYTGEPYWHHCQAVAELVASTGADTDTVAAAWLHDTVEDCEVDVATIGNVFNGRIAMFVYYLTDTPKGYGNRRERKDRDVNRLATAPAPVQTIKLADLIDNTSSIVEHDPQFAKLYLAEKRTLLSVLTKGNSDLYSRAFELAHQNYTGTASEGRMAAAS